ncbi:MAG: DUF4446 family protein [Armatimonadota bacterium]
MDNLSTLVNEYGVFIFLALTIFCIVLLIMCISLFSRIRKIDEKRGMVLPEDSVGNILDNQKNHSQLLSEHSNKLDQIMNIQNKLSLRIDNCIQHIGLVRFNAFDDVGGEQSFALALLDENQNGIIVSNIYGRQDTRIYAKNVKAGKCERALSDEETKAVNMAMKSESLAAH